MLRMKKRDMTFSIIRFKPFTTFASFIFTHSRACLLPASLALAACSGGGGSGVVAMPDSFQVNKGQSLSVSAPGVLGNDVGAEPPAQLVTGPSHASSFTLHANGAFEYTHDNDTATTDSFTYRASNSSTTTVTLAINQPPVIGNSCQQTGANESINQPISGMLAANDPEGQPLTYNLVSDGTKGNVTITNPLSGAFTYTPNTNSRGSDTFTFQVSDGVLTTQGTYTIVHTPRIMPLGDSITDGVNVGGGGCDLGDNNCPANGERVGYRKDLKDALTAAGYQFNFVGSLQSGGDSGFLPSDPQHEGHGGCTIARLVTGTGNNGCAGSGMLSEWLTAQKPDVVLLHIGTNDLGNGSDPNTVYTAVNSILDTIDAWALANWPVTVVMAGIVNKFPTSTTWTTFNSNVFNNIYLTRKNDPLAPAVWVNQELALTLATDYGDGLQTITPLDNIHPSPAGYQKMSNVWLYPLSGTGTSIGSEFPSSLAAGFLPKCP